MTTNGHSSQERPTVRRIHALPSPCKSCGVEATILYTTHALIPESAILAPPMRGVGRNSGAPQMVIGPGIEAHLLCLHCLRREHWTPGGKEWMSTLVDDGNFFTKATGYDADAPASPGS